MDTWCGELMWRVIRDRRRRPHATARCGVQNHPHPRVLGCVDRGIRHADRCRRSVLPDDFDCASRSGRSRQPSGAGDERYVRWFGLGDVAGVVDRHVVAQLPATSWQSRVRRPLHRKSSEVVQRESGSSRIEPPGGQLSPPYGRNLEIDQRGSDQLLAPQSCTRPVTIVAVIAKRRRENAGVHHNQRWSRSTRKTVTAPSSAGDACPVPRHASFPEGRRPPEVRFPPNLHDRGRPRRSGSHPDAVSVTSLPAEQDAGRLLNGVSSLPSGCLDKGLL